VHALRTDVPARSPLRVRRRRRPRPAFSSSKAWWPTWRRGGADRRRPARPISRRWAPWGVAMASSWRRGPPLWGS